VRPQSSVKTGGIAGVLLFAPDRVTGTSAFAGWFQIAASVIGVVTALLGVAGGEFLIPTLVLLFGAEIKLAGSLSLAVSLPNDAGGFRPEERDALLQYL